MPDQGEACVFARTVPGSRFREQVAALRPDLGELKVIFERPAHHFPPLGA